jgi:hypothetical protein
MICGYLTWLRQEAVRDRMRVSWKLKDRKVFLQKETRSVLVYGPGELRQQVHRTTAAETGTASNRYDWRDSGMKTVNRCCWKVP